MRVCFVLSDDTILTIESRENFQTERFNQRSVLAQCEISTPSTRQGKRKNIATLNSRAANVVHVTGLNTARAWQHDRSKKGKENTKSRCQSNI